MPQRLGQHFLQGPWRHRIFEQMAVRGDQFWLEIGAGRGEMTRELAARAGRVVAVEVDPRLVESLRELQRQAPNLEVVSGDVLALDLSALAGAERVHVYGNIPYYITGPILRHLFAHIHALADIHLVVQLEVAARLTARPGRRDYGFLSVLARFYTTPEFLLRIPPGAFRPAPRVASALVRLRPPGMRAQLAIPNEAEFVDFLARCFEQKRKTLRNNLRSVVGARAEALLAAAGLASNVRAEQLTLEQFAVLFRML
ncbi:MAG: 16S rRNA (adenine(1518)-N(6)/adenine(1519)-N(6))-dimethyltransferase RsmA [Acidobacteriia bacterium]|jgi:16S rRNA (adenine1518-N6/adenine1519-N6)-dimethyltransferase|nr:16S rRNA (adenine(1518)-N(6)/adenine(1519)-N(6))-dimethyltransferase RsmA [Terriglobia bacterium]